MVFFIKKLGNGIQRSVGVLAAHVHNDLSGNDAFCIFLAGGHHGKLHTVMLADNIRDHFGSDGMLGIGINDVFEDILYHCEVNFYIIQFGIGNDFIEGSFKLPDVGFYICSNVFQNLILDIKVLLLGILAKDCHSGFIVRCLNICDQSHFKTGTEAFIQCFHLLGRTIERTICFPAA